MHNGTVMNTLPEIPAKPRVLIVDDSRIVRATLVKHVEGMFEFKEALNGEQAWEILLLDPNIRVVITDLTMPKLDGYGLLQRIRTSKISRIRNIPVIVISGSDEQEEHARAKAAGANDLITKGIATAQLLSRLDVLAKLTNTQPEFERSFEVLVQNARQDPDVQLASAEALETHANMALSNAIRQGRNFVILSVSIGLKLPDFSEKVTTALPPASVIAAVGQLLQRSVRQTDCVAQTGDNQFTFATGNIHFDSARNFAQRICGAIANANVLKEGTQSFIASCGMIALSEYGSQTASATTLLKAMRSIAHERAVLGLSKGISGVVGAKEEAVLRSGPPLLAPIPDSKPEARASDPVLPEISPDLATLLQWIREGKQDQALCHIRKHTAELQPLLELMSQQTRPA